MRELPLRRSNNGIPRIRKGLLCFEGILVFLLGYVFFLFQLVLLGIHGSSYRQTLGRKLQPRNPGIPKPKS